MIRAGVVAAVLFVIGPRLEQAPPLSVVLLVDVTASVSDAMTTIVATYPTAPRPDGTGAFERPPRPDVVRKSNAPQDLFVDPIRIGFIQDLRAGERARIGSIARTRRVGASFTTDRAALTQMLRDAVNVPDEERYGPTPLWDALDESIPQLGRETGRRAILLITDGLSTGNRVGLGTVIEHAARSGVVVSVICEAWGSPRIAATPVGVNVGDHAIRNRWHVMAPLDKTPDVNLRRLTAATGGMFLMDGENGKDPDLATALRRVLAFLRR